MPIFGNKPSADQDDGKSSLEPDDVAAPERTAPVGDDEQVGGSSGGVSDPEDDAGSGAQDSETEPEVTSSEEDGEDPSDEDADLDLADDLMSIFTSEEEEDEELSALTANLEDVDASALLIQARELVQRLRGVNSPF